MELEYLTTDEAAERLRLARRTLELMRSSGRGPRYRYHGRRVLYAPEDLKAWSEANARTSTSEKGAAA